MTNTVKFTDIQSGMVAARGGGGGDWDKMGKGSCYLMIIKEVKEYQVCKMKCFEDNCKTM